MVKISKKIVNRLMVTVPKFQGILKQAKNRDINESDTVEILTDILEAVFGYDKYLEITSEYRVRGRFCDIAIKVGGKVQFIMEAKAVGITLKENHIRQSVDYAANLGSQWIILTNGLEWSLYRLKFERPINYELILSFDFLAMNPQDEQHQEQLFLLSKEGLEKDVRDEFYEKVKILNSSVIGQLIMSEPILKTLKRELSKISEGVKFDIQELDRIVRYEVLRRNLVESEEAVEAKKIVDKALRKKGMSKGRKKKKAPSKEIQKDTSPPIHKGEITETEDSEQKTTQ